MSKERELLERAMESLDGGFLYRLELKEEIRAYLAEPEAKRERLSYEEIKAALSESHYDKTGWVFFLRGIRFAEKHHGIGGGE